VSGVGIGVRPLLTTSRIAAATSARTTCGFAAAGDGVGAGAGALDGAAQATMPASVTRPIDHVAARRFRR
jgi:hypothetical protein